MSEIMNEIKFWSYHRQRLGERGSQMIFKLDMFEKLSSRLYDEINDRFDEIGGLLKAKSLLVEEKQN